MVSTVNYNLNTVLIYFSTSPFLNIYHPYQNTYLATLPLLLQDKLSSSHRKNYVVKTSAFVELYLCPNQFTHVFSTTYFPFNL
jgi:hypothetical protein